MREEAPKVVITIGTAHRLVGEVLEALASLEPGQKILVVDNTTGTDTSASSLDDLLAEARIAAIQSQETQAPIDRLQEAHEALEALACQVEGRTDRRARRARKHMKATPRTPNWPIPKRRR